MPRAVVSFNTSDQYNALIGQTKHTCMADIVALEHHTKEHNMLNSTESRCTDMSARG